MSYLLCADIGATKINTGLVKDHQVIKNHKVDTGQKKGLAFTLRQLKKSLEIYQPKNAGAIALAWAGPVDFKRGVILGATNFPKTVINYRLIDTVEKWFKRPVFIEHDGLCFTLAESILGAAKKYRDVIGLTLGTGIGGGLVIDKKIYRGYKNLMEIGHMKITENGFKCSCGQSGHFESQASGPALSKYYKKISGQEKSPQEIEGLAKLGNKAALKASLALARYLGIGLANYINILSPDILVIGGGLSRFKMILDRAKKETEKYLVYPKLYQIRIVKSKLEDNALLLGASLIVDKKYQS